MLNFPVRLRHTLSASVVLMCFCSPLLAQSASCFSRSPSWQGDNYVFDAMNIHSLTAKEHRSLSKMFKRVAAKGKLKGKSETFDCYGNESKPRRVTKTYTVTANVEVGSANQLSMTFEFESKKDGSSFQRHLRLYLADNKLRIGSASPAGDVELIFADNNEATYLVKSRIRIGTRNGSGSGSLAREEIKAITLSGRTLRIEMIGYTQGILSHGFTWEFR